MRHYEVISPEMTMYSWNEPPDRFRCWGVYLAQNKRDARVQAVKDPEFREWVNEQRASNMSPFKGLTASVAVCEHGVCWACATDGECNCDECAAYLEPDLAL